MACYCATINHFIKHSTESLLPQTVYRITRITVENGNVKKQSSRWCHYECNGAPRLTNKLTRNYQHMIIRSSTFIENDMWEGPVDLHSFICSTSVYCSSCAANNKQRYATIYYTLDNFLMEVCSLTDHRVRL